MQGCEARCAQALPLGGSHQLEHFESSRPRVLRLPECTNFASQAATGRASTHQIGTQIHHINEWKRTGTGDVAQAGKVFAKHAGGPGCNLGEHEPGVVLYACYSNPGGGQQGGSESGVHSELHSKSKASLGCIRPCHKIKIKIKTTQNNPPPQKKTTTLKAENEAMSKLP